MSWDSTPTQRPKPFRPALRNRAVNDFVVILQAEGDGLLPRHLTAREPRRFQRLHRFSPNPNIYNKPGNLLSLKKQPRRLQQIGLGHSSGTVEKQGAT